MDKDQKTKQGNRNECNRITVLEDDVKQLRSLVQEQADQLAKQQKLLQLIQFSWLTFFFVVFNVVLLVLFVSLFMREKGPNDLVLMVTATPIKAKFVSERVRVKISIEDLIACLADSLWGKS
eukprot:CCRYP_006940-RA/>CCRYP_006940-RA protein AED:0.01 eAED:0.01 QI:129/1/1/1/1/1/2/606/121